MMAMTLKQTRDFITVYNDSTLLGSYSQTIERTANADLRTNPSMYTVEMRIRGNKVRVYSESSYTLRFRAVLNGSAETVM